MALQTLGGYATNHNKEMIPLLNKLPYRYKRKSGSYYGPDCITINTANNEIQVIDDVRYELEGSVEDVVNMLSKYLEYPGASIDLEAYDDYGSATVRATVSYFIKPTQEELVIIKKLQKLQKEHEKQENERRTLVLAERAIKDLENLGYKVEKKA